MSAQKTAIVLGGTGAVGREILSNLLSNPSYTAVYSFGRRDPFTLPHFASSSTSGPAPSKFTHTNLDVSQLSSSQELQDKLKDVRADVVFIALGTTRKAAGSAEEFVKIDREYVIDAAKAARNGGGGMASGQRLLYCSSAGSSATSSFLYPQSKGLTELELSNLGYDETIIFRPAFLDVPKGREQPKPFEGLAKSLISPFTHFSSSLSISTPTLGLAFSKVGLLGIPELESKKIGNWLDVKGKIPPRISGKLAADGKEPSSATAGGGEEREEKEGKFWLLGNSELLKLGKEA